MFVSEQSMIISIMLILFVTGTLIQVWVSHFYMELIRETENMAATNVEVLCECKKKYSNCYRLYNGVLNVPIFVEKYLGKIKIGRFSSMMWKQLSNQIILLAMLVAGIGVYRGIINEKTLGYILPYYIVSMLGLYFYFAITGFVDITGKKKMLKVNLVDYLENHMGNKISELENSMKLLSSPEPEEKEVSQPRKRPVRIGKEEDNKELEALLREFLA